MHCSAKLFSLFLGNIASAYHTKFTQTPLNVAWWGQCEGEKNKKEEGKVEQKEKEEEEELEK